MRPNALFVLSAASLLSFVPASWSGSWMAAGCTRPAPESGAPHAAEAASPGALASPGADAAAASGAVPPAASARGALADGGTLGAADTSRADAAGAAAADDTPIHVKVATIGMHVGGGPYDEPTKEPIRRSVEPRFAELARCWKLVGKPQPADVGVDLVIEADGGRAKVSNPRTTVTSEGFIPCVVAFFEQVDFLKPKNGKTVVSYSVRFTP
jgi:hypothetical protein